MKVVQINATYGRGSTGKICSSIGLLLERIGMQSYVLYSSGNACSEEGSKIIKYKFCYYLEQKCNALINRFFGNNGFNSRFSTFRLIIKLKTINPDIVHLHNLHSNDINLSLLFNYFRKNNIKVVWTFHDCWAFTGYCTYFDYTGCDKWKKKCCSCPQRKRFSWIFDKSTYNFVKKKQVYQGNDIVVVTPSVWLADLTRQSMFRDCTIKTINNGIDLTVFYPRDRMWRNSRGIKSKYIVLGVAFGWGKRKGLNSFLYLAKQLDTNYQIILVGTDSEIDKQLPEIILSIHRTNDQIELAEIYSAADVFVNPTLEENFPTVNMEAIACGTPVVSFNTGGSSETFDESCGIAVPKGNNELLLSSIKDVCEKGIISRENCVKKSKDYDMWKRFSEYIELYKTLERESTHDE